MWYPRSGVVLDCIDSWYLPPFLLSLMQLTTSVVQILRIPIIPLISVLLMKSSITARWWLMEDCKELGFFVKIELQSIYTSIVSCVNNSLKTHTFFSVICGVSFFICAVCIVYVCSVLTCNIITSLCLLYKSFGYIYCLRVALCGMIVTLLDSSVSFFLFCWWGTYVWFCLMG